MRHHTWQRVEDEIFLAIKDEPHSFQRLEQFLENVVSRYGYLELTAAHHLIELGSVYPSRLSVFHFAMEKTRGHIIASQVLPLDLLMLHFYVHNDDTVPIENAIEAQERLKAYWNPKTTIKKHVAKITKR